MPPRTPRIPGEVVAEETVTEQTEALRDAAASNEPVPEVQAEQPAAEETVVVSKASLDALMARLDRLESAKSSPISRAANPDAELPHQDEVNPDQIKSPVLTKQGWVVPTNFGANPAAKAL